MTPQEGLLIYHLSAQINTKKFLIAYPTALLKNNPGLPLSHRVFLRGEIEKLEDEILVLKRQLGCAQKHTFSVHA
jgi:hypothetical protein